MSFLPNCFQPASRSLANQPVYESSHGACDLSLNAHTHTHTRTHTYSHIHLQGASLPDSALHVLRNPWQAYRKGKALCVWARRVSACMCACMCVYVWYCLYYWQCEWMCEWECVDFPTGPPFDEGWLIRMETPSKTGRLVIHPALRKKNCVCVWETVCVCVCVCVCQHCQYLPLSLPCSKHTLSQQILCVHIHMDVYGRARINQIK